MSEADRRKWDARYAAGAYAGRRHPTALLTRWLEHLPRGRALDVGCGTGRNASFLAAAGFEVDAVDISPVALERARANAAPGTIHFIEADLQTESLDSVLPDRRYALIVMIRYVNAQLMASLPEKLEDGGHLLVEQHLITKRNVVGPQTAAFRMRGNELLDAAGDLRVLYYREGLVEEPDGRTAALAQLLACRGIPFFESAALAPR